MAVPDTTTFSLQDVVDEINPTTDDLVDCIADADSGGYDPSYYTAPATSLLEFRNYEESAGTITVQFESSTDYSEGSNPDDGFRSLEITGMVSGDIITVYYKVWAWHEETQGTTELTVRIRENSGTWQTEYNGTTEETSNESHAGIDYNDTVDIRGIAESGHPDDWCGVDIELTSVTVTAGGKTGVIGARDTFSIESGLIM